MKKLLGDTNVRLLFSSQLISSVCDKMMTIGLVWYLTKNHSITIVPWFLAVSFLPHLLFSFFTTSFIRRLGPFRTVLYSEFFRGLVLLGLWLILIFIPGKGDGELVALMVSAFLVGIGSCMFNPAILSLPPMVVEEEKVVGMNALLDSSVSFSTVLGAALGVFLLTLMDLQTLVLLNGSSYVIAGLLECRVKLLPARPTVTDSVPNESPRQVIRKHPRIARMLGSFLFINLTFTPILVFIPWIVDHVYAGTAQTLSAMEGAMGLGAIVSAVYYTSTGLTLKPDARIRMIATVAFFFGALFILLSFTTAIWQGISVLFIVGLLNSFLNIEVLSYFQTSIHEREVPAVMTIVNLISVASIPLSMTLTGLVFPYVDVLRFALVCGASTVMVSLLLPRLLNDNHAT